MTGDSPAMLAFRRLAAAVVLRAARDATAADPERAAPARRWLAGDGCDLAEQLSIDAGRVIRWLDGLPILVQSALPGM